MQNHILSLTVALALGATLPIQADDNWHWFLSHDAQYLGGVHVETGAVEYLELLAQLMASTRSRADDVWLWKNGNPKNNPVNASGFSVCDKGQKGTGWGKSQQQAQPGRAASVSSRRQGNGLRD